MNEWNQKNDLVLWQWRHYWTLRGRKRIVCNGSSDRRVRRESRWHLHLWKAGVFSVAWLLVALRYWRLVLIKAIWSERFRLIPNTSTIRLNTCKVRSLLVRTFWSLIVRSTSRVPTTFHTTSMLSHSTSAHWHVISTHVISHSTSTIVISSEVSFCEKKNVSGLPKMNISWMTYFCHHKMISPCHEVLD